MINLTLAIICSALISIFMRLSKGYVKNEMVMYMSNYMVCIVLALCFMKDISQISVLADADGRFTLILGILTGVLYLVNLAFMKFNIGKNGVVMSSTFSKLGVVVSILISILAFHQIPSFIQVIGILLAIGAIILINMDKKASIEKGNIAFLLGLLVLTGVTDSTSSIFEQMGEASLKDGYLFTTFGTALVVSFVVALVKRQKVEKYDALFGVMIGVPNYFSSRFLLAALAEIEAVLVYPIFSVATLVIITIVGVGFFKEKTTKQKLCALGLIVLALALLNM